MRLPSAASGRRSVPALCSASRRPALAADLGEPAIGDPAAPVTIIEYSSLTCPHCAAFHAKTLPELKKRYIDTGKVRLVLRDFPLDQSRAQGRGDRPLRRPGAPAPVHRGVLRPAGELGAGRRPGAGAQAAGPARRAGRRPRSTPASPTRTLEDAVLQARLDGQQKFDINSTPSFIIDGKTYAGDQSVEQFAALIDPLLGPVGFRRPAARPAMGRLLPQHVASPPLEITRLRVSGFKSFSEPVELQLEAGLTGIVGPNGCGKSNIVEALRWAMGESSAKGLRGDEMEDVIFNGSADAPGPRRGRGPPQAARAARGPGRLRRGAASSRSRAGSAAASARPTASTAARRGRATSSSCSPTPAPARAARPSSARARSASSSIRKPHRPAPAARGRGRHRRPAGAPARGRAAAGGDPGQPAAGARPAGHPGGPAGRAGQAEPAGAALPQARGRAAQHRGAAAAGAPCRRRRAGPPPPTSGVAAAAAEQERRRRGRPRPAPRSAPRRQRGCRRCATAAAGQQAEAAALRERLASLRDAAGREAAHLAALTRQRDEADADLARAERSDRRARRELGAAARRARRRWCGADATLLEANGHAGRGRWPGRSASLPRPSWRCARSLRRTAEATAQLDAARERLDDLRRRQDAIGRELAGLPAVAQAQASQDRAEADLCAARGRL